MAENKIGGVFSHNYMANSFIISIYCQRMVLEHTKFLLL